MKIINVLYFIGVLLCANVATASDQVLEFDLEGDVQVLKSGVAENNGRRYVEFHITHHKETLRKSILPLVASETNMPCGTRVFHERSYEVKGQVGALKVYPYLDLANVDMYVRSSPLKYDLDFWALYELRVPQESTGSSSTNEFSSIFFALRYLQTST